MRRIVLLVILAGTLATPLPARATGTLTRTFVSSAGVDSNPCTAAQPCATFAAAYNAVVSNGIIAALDPGKYGALTITGPITIDGNGWAAITAPTNGIGITVNAGPSDKIVLRGLRLDGVGTGSGGIEFKSGQSLTLIDCVVRNMASYGLSFTNRATTPATLTVSNSQFDDNGVDGIGIGGLSSGAILASIDRTELNNNGQYGIDVNGVLADGPITIAITNSSATNNGLWGFLLASVANGNFSQGLTLTNCLVAGNGTGVEVSGGAVIWLAQSTVVGNQTGFNASAESLLNSYRDNYFADNGPNVGSLTPVQTH